VPNFVIQGGDPRGDGYGDPGYRILDEISPHLPHTRGAVGMSKMAKDTGDGQLYITHVPTPHLDGRYTVFGTVVTGLDVIDRIEPGDRILSARATEER
jgi:cyclophilin family peptidyl-prolyl cis-trans isomerase